VNALQTCTVVNALQSCTVVNALQSCTVVNVRQSKANGEYLLSAFALLLHSSRAALLGYSSRAKEARK
jgi:hypothetical protein